MNTDMISILFVGDILLHSDYNKIVSEQGPSFIFEKISGVFNDADLRCGNLECVLSEKGAPLAGKGCLIGDKRYIASLGETGFNVVSLANNHTFDYGADAYEDMRINLKKERIKAVGAGRNLNESRKLISVSINGVRLGFLAYSSRDNNGRNYATDTSPGVAPLEEQYLIEDIKKYTNDVDHLVISLHWGIEHSPYPTPEQISLAHRAVDAGAGIIFGNHPQILQGIENYKGGLIMYSLGNFCHSDYYWEGTGKTYQFKIKPVDRESVMVMVKASKDKIEDINIIPIWINEHGQPEVCKDERFADISRKLSDRSEKIKKPDFDNYWNDIIIRKRVKTPFRLWWENGNLLYKIKNFKPSQIKTLMDLLILHIQLKFSKSPSKWQLFNPRNDKKPRPFCGDE